jgi:hypothetical protein
MSKSKAALSLFDFLKGVAQTEKKLVEKYPEAAKVPIAKRQQTKDMMPAEVIDLYNREGMLGKFRSGAPAVADIVQYVNKPGVRYDTKEAVTGALPKEAYIRFMEEDQLNKPVQDRVTRGRFSIEQDESMEGALDMYPSVKKLLEEARRNPSRVQRVFNREPVTRHLTTTTAPPDIGSQGYQMSYDIKRGSGDVGVADILTPLNIVRRPLNVMNYGLAHGDYRNVMPLSDRGIGSALEQMGMRLYDAKGDDSKVAQLEYLKNLFGDEDLAEEIMTLDPVRLAVMGMSRSPENATGYLSLVNAMRAATAGPERYRMFRESIHPGDSPALKDTVDLDLIRSKTNPVAAFGPGALGRARTAEAAVKGLKQQMTPDEIVEELTKGVDPSGFFGRYRHGGGVRKYKAGGLSALQAPTPVEAPTPDPLVEMIMRQLGVPAGGQPSPEQLEQFNEMYNRMLEQRRLREETYDYPFREHDAALG